MNKKQTIISILAVVIVAITLLVIKLNTGTNDSENKTRKPTQNKQESITPEFEQEIEENTENNSKEQDIENEVSEDIPSNVNETKDESGREMTDADIDNITIEIVKMKDSVKEQIGDMKAFEYAIKKFFYTFGVMEREVICMNEVSYLYETNQISYQMYVSNHSFTYFEVVYDMETESYKVPIMEE